MFLRILRPNESGSYRAGLVGVLFPEQGNFDYLVNKESGILDSGDQILESRVLVSIREPNRNVLSYLLTGYEVEKVEDPADYVQTAPKPTFAQVKKERRALWISLTAVVVIVLVAVGFAGFTGLFSMRVVLTGSMQPTINPGDVIVTVSDNLVSPKKGDVVVYTGKKFDGTPVAPFAHRIIGGSAADGWVVQGDNNPVPDVQHPTSADIESVVVGTIPFVGRFFNLQFLILIVALVFGIWLIVDGVRDRS